MAGAAAQIEEAITLFRSVGDERGIAVSLTSLAAIVSQQGEYARAVSLAEESLARLQGGGRLGRHRLGARLFGRDHQPAGGV